jgi:hypothetical protein
MSFKILSSRNFSTGCYWPAAWAAENALASILHTQIFAPNLPRRQYILFENRIARIVSRICKAQRNLVFFGSGKDVFLFLMGFNRETLPLLCDKRKRKWIYVFDCWQPEWENTEKLLKSAANIERIYFSGSQAAEHFSNIFPTKVSWLPQAADSSEFPRDRLTLDKRLPIILNIGRSNTVLDEFFLEYSKNRGLRYLYPGSDEFRNLGSRVNFLTSLQHASIVVVHPRNLQTPEITGCVSMLTARYFEAYSAGAVVCGFKPTSDEFQQVLGSMPFVEFSENFSDELDSALLDTQKWEKAQLRCLKLHTWEARLMPVAVEIKNAYS